MAVVIPRGLVNPPPPVVSESPDGRLRATVGEDGAGVLLEADFSSGPTVTSVEPFQVRFLRRSAAGDVPVRSGDPAWSPRGQAVAYDHEAPFDVGVSWVAVPVYRDGPGEESELASLRLPFDRSDERCLWLKGVDGLVGSVRALPVGPLPTLTRSSRTTFTTIPGSPYPSGSRQRRQARTSELSLWTDTVAERDALLLLMDAGCVLMQYPGSFGISDLYFEAGDVTETVPGAGLDEPERILSWPITEVARPATVDAPLFVPGRSYDEAGRVAGTYDEAASVWPTYADAVRL